MYYYSLIKVYSYEYKIVFLAEDFSLDHNSISIIDVYYYIFNICSKNIFNLFN